RRGRYRRLTDSLIRNHAALRACCRVPAPGTLAPIGRRTGRSYLAQASSARATRGSRPPLPKGTCRRGASPSALQSFSRPALRVGEVRRRGEIDSSLLPVTSLLLLGK